MCGASRDASARVVRRGASIGARQGLRCDAVDPASGPAFATTARRRARSVTFPMRVPFAVRSRSVRPITPAP
ncbi:hypothetical protein DR62_07880 [Burkholderia thailandensis]|uniref:Uncharacterized protein n=1 Tax=Burkholderia thailandensis TaxID=57975 RepID=A0AAW9CS19_BURTH|nr:hypothetical protein DR62_07880 [Burkholderia thailandensis]AOI55666.1 hypothetical protein WI24_28580 [Burkholderia thailandensis]AOJ54632.1 hypothetical protein AQ475_28370 [Burkholderia thailandensis]AVR27199.1 hypothetical protein A8H32_18985 [Burkholderia thailandensis]MDD1482527.1 hypothetical protein [Burkholderia thailandensis]